MANKPIREKKTRSSKKEGQETEEPLSPTKNQQDQEHDHGHQEPDREYDIGTLDEIDFDPVDGNSSGGGFSSSYSEEQPEKLRASSSVDGGSVKAPSKRSSRMSDSSSFIIPESYSMDGRESAARSSLASSRRSKLSVIGDDPFDMNEESHHSLYADSSLCEEPESHPSLLKNHSQLPLSQVLSFSSSLDALQLPPAPSCLLRVALKRRVCSDRGLCMSSAFRSTP